MASIETLEGIRETFHRYAIGFDEDDFDVFANCFSEDAVFSTATVAEIAGRDAICAHFKRRRTARRERGEQSRHLIDNVLVLEADDASALAVAYVTALVVVSEAAPTMHFGWYRDRFVRDADRWRIARHYIHADGSDAAEPILGPGGAPL